MGWGAGVGGWRYSRQCPPAGGSAWRSTHAALALLLLRLWDVGPAASSCSRPAAGAPPGQRRINAQPVFPRSVLRRRGAPGYGGAPGWGGAASGGPGAGFAGGGGRSRRSGHSRHVGQRARRRRTGRAKGSGATATHDTRQRRRAHNAVCHAGKLGGGRLCRRAPPQRAMRAPAPRSRHPDQPVAPPRVVACTVPTTACRTHSSRCCRRTSSLMHGPCRASRTAQSGPTPPPSWTRSGATPVSAPATGWSLRSARRMGPATGPAAATTRRRCFWGTSAGAAAAWERWRTGTAGFAGPLLLWTASSLVCQASLCSQASVCVQQRAPGPVTPGTALPKRNPAVPDTDARANAVAPTCAATRGWARRACSACLAASASPPLSTHAGSRRCPSHRCTSSRQARGRWLAAPPQLLAAEPARRLPTPGAKRSVQSAGPSGLT